MAPPPVRYVPRYPVSWRARQHIRKADLRRDLEEMFYVLESGSVVVPSVSSLQGLDTRGYVEGAVPVVVTGLGAFQWDPLSVVAHDGIYVVQPTGVTGAGRWVRPQPAALTGVSTPGTRLFALADHTHAVTVPEVSVANLTALAAVPTGNDLVGVQTLKCLFRRIPSSTLTPDGITIVAALGGGNWERLVSTTSLDWLAQASWFLDPVLGNDENDGSTSAPLLTSAELNRRLSVGKLQQSTTLTIPAGAIIAEIDLGIDPGAFTFEIVGIATTVYTGTIATFTERTHVGLSPEAQLVTDSGVSDWTPYVGQRLRLTSGVNAGAMAWLAKANPAGLGLNVARISRCASPPGATSVPALAPPSPGDTFVVESLPEVRALSLVRRTTNPTQAIIYNSLKLSSLYLSQSTQRLNLNALNSSVIVDGCNLQTQLNLELNCQLDQKHLISRCRLKSSSLTGGPVDFECCLQVGSMNQSMSCMRFRRHTAQCDSANQYGFYQALATIMVVQAYLRDVQLFDYTRASIFLQNACIYECLDGLSGNGNAIGVLICDPDNEALTPQIISWAQTVDAPNLLGTVEVRIAGTPNMDLSWATIFAEGGFHSDHQRGTSAVANGTVIVTARNSNIRPPQVTLDTPAGGPIGILSAPAATRTNTQFVVNSIDPTTGSGPVVTDQSSFTWEIPPMRRQIIICQANSIT